MKPTESQDSSLKGSNLIFLISQPRAGSTLTQRILGGHPDIHTVSEPWLMLPPLSAWHSTIGYNADYDQDLAQLAVSGFIGSLSQGEEDYVQGLRRMYSYLYEKARTEAGKCYFLDKTPRYFYIINELYRTFPEARFIFLFRNPLSVLCSIVTTWAKDDLHILKKFKNDLFMAPQKLLEGVANLGKQCISMHYEWLLMRSDEEIARVCDFLGISFIPEVVEYGVSNTCPAWIHGDQVKLYQSTKPDSSNLNKWLEDIKEPQIWRLASDYLQILGEETIEKLGYSYHELWSTLNQEAPTIEQLNDTLPLNFYCEQILSSSEVSHFIKLTQKSLGGWIGAKKEAGEALYGLPKQQASQYQESLTRVHRESQKWQTELERSNYQLVEAQTMAECFRGEVEQYQSQLHQTQAELEQYQSQLHQTQAELEQYQSQLHQTQAELEQYQSQLHQTQAQLQECKEELGEFQAIAEQFQERIDQTHAVLENFQSKLHETQTELARTKSQLYQSQWEEERSRLQLHQAHTKLAKNQSELHQIETQLKQSQSQVDETQSLLRESQFEVKQSQTVLKKFQSQIHENKSELKRVDSQLHQTQAELEQSESQLHQTQAELEQSESQLHQTQAELEQSESQLHQTQAELEQSESQLHQTQQELEKLKSQFSQTQVKLVRTQLQHQYVTTEPQSTTTTEYKLLVWDAWYAYQNGNLKKMQQCLQESLKLTQISRTESVVKWLESFAKFSSEKGHDFDSYALTNSEEWKKLIQPKLNGSKR